MRVSEFRIWNSSSLLRLNGALLPKFSPVERATIAAVEVENVAVGGVGVRVRRWGAGGGLPILYWHGGGGGSTESAVLGPCLAAAGPPMPAVDAPGYGESPPLERERYLASTLAELAAELIIEALGLA